MSEHFLATGVLVLLSAFATVHLFATVGLPIVEDIIGRFVASARRIRNTFRS